MPKSFTVEEADRTLPLVRRIVEDIVRHYAIWRERVQQFELEAANRRSDEANPRAETLQRETQALAAEIDGFLRELDNLGVEFKGFDVGLVDFPGEMGGRQVYLCWRLGEPSVQYWHEVDAGYAGRQPLTPVAVG